MRIRFLFSIFTYISVPLLLILLILLLFLAATAIVVVQLIGEYIKVCVCLRVSVGWLEKIGELDIFYQQISSHSQDVNNNYT